MGGNTAIGADRLFRAHAPYIKAFLYKLGLTHMWIDDAVQEVFLVAHAQGGYRPGNAAPRTWLGEIAIRVAANARRKQQRLTRLFPHSDTMALIMQHLPSAMPGADIPLLERELLDQVELTLAAMIELHREVFKRFYMDGEPCTEIATNLGVPIGTVYRRLHDARKHFMEATTTTW